MKKRVNSHTKTIAQRQKTKLKQATTLPVCLNNQGRGGTMLDMEEDSALNMIRAIRC